MRNLENVDRMYQTKDMFEKMFGISFQTDGFNEQYKRFIANMQADIWAIEQLVTDTEVVLHPVDRKTLDDIKVRLEGN